MAKARIILLFLLIASLLTGCSQTQEVVCNELTLELPETFINWSVGSAQSGLAFNYADNQMGICGIYESKAVFTAYFDSLDKEEYARQFLLTNGISSPVTVQDGIPSFSYVASGEDPLQYLCGVFESEENFWVVQAYCVQKDFETLKAQMWEYIKTVDIQ